MFRDYPYSVSVIIPVFNGEKYVSACLDSVLSQTLEDIEVIIVDDGSTDNSVEILEKVRQKDKRVKVYQQQNGGPGSARNHGIAKSTGYAVMFMDIDDCYKTPDTIKKVFERFLETDVDVLVFNGRAFLDNGTDEFKWAKRNYYSLNKSDDDGRIEEGLFFSKRANGQIQQPGMKICRREFLIENDIFFHESKSGVDVYFFYRLFIAAKRVAYFDYVGYSRRYREDSIVTGTSINNVLVRIQTFMDLYSLLDRIEDGKYRRETHKQFLYYICLLWIMAMNRTKEGREILLNAFEYNQLDVLLKKQKMNFVTRLFSLVVNTPAWCMLLKIAFAKIVRILGMGQSNLFVAAPVRK